MRKRIFSVSLLLSVILASVFAFANSGVYEFDSDAKLKSYQRLTNELRCPKCQNQNLTDSNSEISIIMRDVIAESINQGKSESEIKDMMVARYGDFVLYKPPFSLETIALWWAPIIFFAIAVFAFVNIVFKRKRLNNKD